ncbi:MAG: DUF488 domain-containing protein [Rikenellaceae bacterium]|nr:DUF488 domain-containing protein [Rikenellaceae bacterium]
MDSSLFSIGHGNKSIDEFISELNSFNIQFVVDVRSVPYSKWNPHFNQSTLECSLIKHGLRYVYMGDKLGGMPNDSSCYTNGKIDYKKMGQKESFIEGLKRLINANNQQIRVAIMCSESEPEMCHRSKLIGEELRKRDIVMQHIISVQKSKSQIDVINTLTKGMGIMNLFGEEDTLTSRKTYL